MNKYQHRRHNKNLLMVHLILVTKYRKAILTGCFREDIKQYIYETCKVYHWYIKRMETDQDHIHILLQYNPTDSITEIASRLKQHSTYGMEESRAVSFRLLLEKACFMVERIFCRVHRPGIAGNH